MTYRRKAVALICLALVALATVPRMQAAYEGERIWGQGLPPALALEENPLVVIERVIPNKVLYDAKEEATAAIWLKNTTEEPQSAVLVAREFLDLEVERKVAELPLSLTAGEEKRDLLIQWNVGDKTFGRELRVDFLKDGKVITTNSEFYQVTKPDEWFRVNIAAAWDPTPAVVEAGLGVNSALGPFDTYSNFSLYFAWAPDDFSDLTPEVERYYSGQTNYDISVPRQMDRIREEHKSGIRAITYGKFQFCGSVGYEFARQHPEWVVYKKSGSFQNMFWALSPLDLAKPITEKMPSYMQGTVNFYDPEAVRYGTERIIDGAKMFGFDGVWFDGHFFMFPGFDYEMKPTTHGENPNLLSARNVRLCRDTIRKEFPNFVFYYNGLDSEMTSQPFEFTWGNSGGPETVVACLEDKNSGGMLELQGNTIFDAPDLTWEKAFEYRAKVRDERIEEMRAIYNNGWIWNYDVARKMGGMDKYIASHGAWPQTQFTGAIIMACRYHPLFNYTNAWRPFTQFMTRYSALLWDRSISLVKEPQEILSVKASRPLTWERTVYSREGEGFTDYLIHLLNFGPDDKVDASMLNDPPQALDVEVTLAIPEGGKFLKAWALEPYGLDAKLKKPTQVELEGVIDAKSLRVKVPAFRYYTLLVIRLSH